MRFRIIIFRPGRLFRFLFGSDTHHETEDVLTRQAKLKKRPPLYELKQLSDKERHKRGF
jgi:hypothetical protein